MTFFDCPVIVTGLMARRVDYSRRKTVFVPGRPFHALTFRREGRVTVEQNGQSLVSSAGDLTFVPQELSYNTQILEDGSMYIVHFTAQDCPAGLMPQLITPVCPAAFEARFAALCGRFRVGREQDADCLSAFYRILAEAGAEYERQTDSAFCPPRVRRAKSRIDHDFADPSLTVCALAAEAGVSEAFFRREFKAAIGCAPLAYLKRVRLENAKLLLATGYCSVTEAAMQCGFDSVSYFSYEFHRAEGIAPSEFMRRADL